MEDTLGYLSASEITHIQRIVGSVLYYTRYMDSTVHVSINDIETTQTKPT